MKLEQFLSYYPHGLTAKLSEKGIFNLDLEYPNEYVNSVGIITDININYLTNNISGALKINDNYSFDFDSLDELDIILRPLSDLTKEILHNGERFVPIKKMESELLAEGNLKFGRTEYGWVGFHSKEFGINMPIYLDNKIMGECDFMFYEKMCKWHFDIFNLIENNLAIDINTLKN